MVSVTLSIPQKLRDRMKEHSEYVWSDVIRAIIERKLDDLEELDRIAKKSRLTQKDVDEIAEKVDEEMARYFEERANAASG